MAEVGPVVDRLHTREFGPGSLTGREANVVRIGLDANHEQLVQVTPTLCAMPLPRTMYTKG